MPGRKGEGGGEPSAALIRIDPRLAMEGLFKGLYIQAADEYQVDEDLAAAQSVSLRVHALVEALCKHYFGTVLGQVIHPRFGRGLVIDRIIAANEVIVGLLRRRLVDVLARIQAADAEEAARLVETMLSDIEFTFIAMREVVNRFMTLLHLNLPASLRPPLANIRIGYDVVM